MLGSAPSSTVTAVLTMSATVESRMYKGNAASLHHLFVTTDAVHALFTDVSGKGFEHMKAALAEQDICLDDAQIKELCTSANEDDFFRKLLDIQKAEIQSYLNMQPKGPAGAPYTTTPMRYYELGQQLDKAKGTLAKPGDYANLLKSYDAAPLNSSQDKKKKKGGQLMWVMNREYDLYTKVEPKANFGSKAEHVRYHYYAQALNGLSSPPAAGSVYANFQQYVNDKASEFPGGFHAKLDMTYQHKSSTSVATDPMPVGKSQRITIVNLGIPKKELADIINGVSDLSAYGAPGKKSPTLEVRFKIKGTEYGIFAVYNGDDKPLVFQKVKIDAAGNPTGAKTELTAEESANVKADGTGTVLSPPYDKCSSVAHAITLSIKNTQELKMGLTPNYGPTPVVTSNQNAPQHGMNISSGSALQHGMNISSGSAPKHAMTIQRGTGVPLASMSIQPSSSASMSEPDLRISSGQGAGAAPSNKPADLSLGNKADDVRDKMKEQVQSDSDDENEDIEEKEKLETLTLFNDAPSTNKTKNKNNNNTIR